MTNAKMNLQKTGEEILKSVLFMFINQLQGKYFIQRQ